MDFVPIVALIIVSMVIITLIGHIFGRSIE